MFFKTITYLKFLLSSTNQHGVHSPFVFDFVTKGLYQKKQKSVNFHKYPELKKLSRNKVKILSKIVNYFKIDSIHFKFTDFKNDLNSGYNLLYIKDIKKLTNINFDNLSSKHIIIIDKVHLDKNTIKKWQNIINKKEITVSINLFYFGLVFFRKEQAKEHFKIRV